MVPRVCSLGVQVGVQEPSQWDVKDACILAVRTCQYGRQPRRTCLGAVIRTKDAITKVDDLLVDNDGRNLRQQRGQDRYAVLRRLRPAVIDAHLALGHLVAFAVQAGIWWRGCGDVGRQWKGRGRRIGPPALAKLDKIATCIPCQPSTTHVRRRVHTAVFLPGAEDVTVARGSRNKGGCRGHCLAHACRYTDRQVLTTTASNAAEQRVGCSGGSRLFGGDGRYRSDPVTDLCIATAASILVITGTPLSREVQKTLPTSR